MGVRFRTGHRWSLPRQGQETERRPGRPRPRASRELPNTCYVARCTWRSGLGSNWGGVFQWSYTTPGSTTSAVLDSTSFEAFGRSLVRFENRAIPKQRNSTAADRIAKKIIRAKTPFASYFCQINRTLPYQLLFGLGKFGRVSFRGEGYSLAWSRLLFRSRMKLAGPRCQRNGSGAWM